MLNNKEACHPSSNPAIEPNLDQSRELTYRDKKNVQNTIKISEDFQVLKVSKDVPLYDLKFIL